MIAEPLYHGMLPAAPSSVLSQIDFKLSKYSHGIEFMQIQHPQEIDRLEGPINGRFAHDLQSVAQIGANFVVIELKDDSERSSRRE